MAESVRRVLGLAHLLFVEHRVTLHSCTSLLSLDGLLGLVQASSILWLTVGLILRGDRPDVLMGLFAATRNEPSSVCRLINYQRLHVV